MPILLNPVIVKVTYQFIKSICAKSLEDKLTGDDLRKEYNKFLNTQYYSRDDDKGVILVSIARGVASYKQDLLLVAKADADIKDYYKLTIEIFDIEREQFILQNHTRYER